MSELDPDPPLDIEAMLAAVRARIREAAHRSGRDGAAVQLVVVTKKQTVETVRETYALGPRDFGENYAQSLRDKARALADLPDVRWHFLGGLQRNKVKYVVGTAVLIHSVDSVRLLEAIEQRAAALELVQDVLVQVNIGAEPQKSGIDEARVPGLLAAFAEAPHVRCRGMMIVPPITYDEDEGRPYFVRLRELAAKLSQGALPVNVSLEELSMGMSHDYHLGVEEGATMVRVGKAIYGEQA